jgi:hypothetical protein
MIRSALCLTTFPEFVVGRVRYVVSREWRDIVGVHRANDFGADKHEEFSFGFGSGFGLEDTGAEPGNISEQRHTADLCERLAGDESADGKRLSFAEFHRGVDAFNVGARDPGNGVLGIELAELGGHLHADQIAIHDRGGHDKACAEAPEGCC